MEQKILVKYYSYGTLVINICAIIFNLLGYIGLSFSKLPAILLFLIAVGVDLGLIYLSLSSINRLDQTGQMIKRACHIYLIFFLLAVLILFGNSLVYSFFAVGDFIRDLMYIGMIIAYFGIFGIGILVTWLNIQNINQKGTWK